MIIEYYRKVKLSDNRFCYTYEIAEGKSYDVFRAILTSQTNKFVKAIAEMPCQDGVIFQNQVNTKDEAVLLEGFAKCHVYVYCQDKPVYFIVDTYENKLHIAAKDENEPSVVKAVTYSILKELKN